MMEFLNSLLCMVTSRVTRRNGAYVLEIPEQEVEVGSLEEGGRYRVALFEASGDASEDDTAAHTGRVPDTQRRPDTGREMDQPVGEGEVREVEIEDVGEKGDGIARIPPGYVVFVEDTSPGDRVRIEITEARDNFAFAEVIGSL
jgi:predicted RNA-binding protein with TRAM domain